MVEELFQDYLNEAFEDYYRLEAENNPDKSAILGYYNMLDCILNLYDNNIKFFSVASSEKNPYLCSSFYHHIFYTVNSYVERRREQMPPKYSSRQTAALLCYGLWGVINECYKSGMEKKEIRKNVKDMYRDILMSNIFVNRNKR